MHNQVRGKVFMINNKFSHSPALKRGGSEHDVRNLRNLFQQLHFEVVEGSDLSAQVSENNKIIFHWRNSETRSPKV